MPFRRKQHIIARSVSETLTISRHTLGVKKKIEQRKKEYKKLQNTGTEINIDNPGVFIGKTEKGITIRRKGKILKTAPLASLKNINIHSQGVTLSTNHQPKRQAGFGFRFY